MKIAAIAISLALAALSGSRPGQDPGLQVVPEAHVWNYGDLDRTCLRWTHGCVVCDRGSLCSNIGFACTSQFASSAFTGNSGGAQFVRSGERP
jgi:hypothetical protein